MLHQDYNSFEERKTISCRSDFNQTGSAVISAVARCSGPVDERATIYYFIENCQNKFGYNNLLTDTLTNVGDVL